MSKEKDKKKRKKGSQLVIRVEKRERDTFVDLCDRLDTSAARELRRFMREFVAAHAPADSSPPEAQADPDAHSEPAPAAEVGAEAAPPIEADSAAAAPVAKRGRRKAAALVTD